MARSAITAYSALHLADQNALYCSDGFFAPEVPDEHVIPFTVDLDAWLETLARLQNWITRLD